MSDCTIVGGRERASETPHRGGEPARKHSVAAEPVGYVLTMRPQVWGATTVTVDRESSPYVGRRPFYGEDRYRFSGRGEEARELADLWRHRRLTLLCGASGVGRTSLLHAGVVPLLDQAGIEVLPVGRGYRGTAFPLAALAEHNPHTLALLSCWSPGEPETQLSGLTVYDFLRKRPAQYDAYGQPVPLLAAIDQIEDLFTVQPDRYWAAFVGELAEALQEMPQLRLLLSVPDDYLADLVPAAERLSGEEPAIFRLAPLSVLEALDAVRLPLAATHRSFAPDVAESLVANLRTDVVTGAVSAADPDTGDSADSADMKPDSDGNIDPWLLQVVCAGLWAVLPADIPEITARNLVGYGTISHILEAFCADAIAAVAVDHGMPAVDLARWLRETFVTGGPGPRGRSRIPAGTAQTAGMPNTVFRRLREWHLLAITWHSGTRWYALRHEALVDPVLRVVDRDLGELEAELGAKPAVFLRAAETAMADGDLVRAERHAHEVLRGARGTDLRLCGETESLLGNVAYSRRDPEQAETRYRAAAAIFEILQDTRAVAGLLAAVGKTLLVQGRHAEAVEHLHSAVGRIPNDLTVQTELAWALWRAGQQRAAVEVLTSVLAIDGAAPDALRARGEILADMGDAEGALRDLDRVRRSEHPSTLAAHGLALAMLRGASAADPKIDAALSQAPQSGPVLVYAARAAALGQHLDIAADLARRAVNATDPAVPPHQRRQALQLMELADLAAGGSQWRRVEVEVEPLAG